MRLFVLLLGLWGHQKADGGSVLVLGGTGFRGHLTTERLLREGHSVTVLSRGNSYWGILEKLQDHIVHWKCNRTLALDHGRAPLPASSGLVNCTPLVESTDVFDVVVDFSTRTLEEMKQAIKLLEGRAGVYVFASSHAVYDISKDSSHGGLLLETDAARPGRNVSPLDRFNLKEKSERGDNDFECEEELLKQYNAGGFPFVTLRLANPIGPKENTVRYWLLHLWVKACLALTMPLHLDTGLLEMPISLTFTPDVAQAVVRVIKKSQTAPEEVHGEAFNIACEELPTQRTLYNHIAEPIGMPFVETIEMDSNRSIVLYPDNIRGPVSTAKAQHILRWSPTDFSKALRSVARFYERVMMDEGKHRTELDLMYKKTKKMLGEDGPRFVEWIRAYYTDRRKTELYDELDDEDEDDIVLALSEAKKKKKVKPRQSSKQKDDL